MTIEGSSWDVPASRIVPASHVLEKTKIIVLLFLLFLMFKVLPVIAISYIVTWFGFIYYFCVCMMPEHIPKIRIWCKNVQTFSAWTVI